MNKVQVRVELKQLEPIFHTPATYPIASRVEELLDIDFCEIGCSGRQHTRADVVSVLAERINAGVFEMMEAEGLVCAELSTETYLVRYTLNQKDRITRRSSIWRRVNGLWKILFHQGTVVQ